MAIPRIIQGDGTAANGRSLVLQLGRLRLRKNGLVQTISNTVPVLVTDCVERAEAAALSGNGINLTVKVNTSYVPVAASQLTQASTLAEFKVTINIYTGKWKVEPAY